MKAFAFLFLLIGLIPLNSFSQSPNYKRVSLQVISNSIEAKEKLYVTGNQPAFGSWNPSEVDLEKINDTTWSQSFSFPKGTILEFKFTKGSWDTEAATSDNSPRQNSTLKVAKDTIVQFHLPHWRNGEPKEIQGQITGKVVYHRQLSGVGILPRDVIVWLPPHYEANTNERYPVLYMHDGQNIIDPKTASFQVDWQVDETADSLIRKQAIKPLIIVGIYNTADRTEDYSEGEKGTAYMKFLVEKLKPLIDETYRTKPKSKDTFIGGSSMGGMISFMSVWEYPTVFSAAICMSPALKVREFNYVDNVVAYTGRKKPVRFYLDNGGVGIEEILQPGIDEMLVALRAKGYQEGKDILWIKDSNAKHFESDWAARFGKALIFLVEGK